MKTEASRQQSPQSVNHSIRVNDKMTTQITWKNSEGTMISSTGSYTTGTSTIAEHSKSVLINVDNQHVYSRTISNSSTRTNHLSQLIIPQSRSFQWFLLLFIVLRISIHLAYCNYQSVLIMNNAVSTQAAKKSTTLASNLTINKDSQFVCTGSTSDTSTSPWWMASYPSINTSSNVLPTIVIYPSYPQIPLPCFPASFWRISNPRKFKPLDQGLVFIKLVKVASSTAAGIHLRLADREAQRRRQQVTYLEGSSTSHSDINNNDSHRKATPIISFPQLSSNKSQVTSSMDEISMCLANYRHGAANQLVGSEAWPHSWNQTRDNGDDLQQGTVLRHQRAAQLRVWTMVREPTVRALSAFFFFESTRKRNEPTVNRIIAFLQGSQSKRDPFGHYCKWLNTNKMTMEQWKNRGPDFIHQIMTDFDFIGVTERFDESLVVLSFLWQIPLGDLLYLSPAKAHGSWTLWLQGSKQYCYLVKEPPPSIFQSPQIQEYLRSPEWRERVYLDQLIYQSAVSSLDATIASIGVDRVQERLQAFRAAQAVAAQACPPAAYQPCYPNGTAVQQGNEKGSGFCYDGDIGCGHTCLDQVANRLGIHEYHEL
jgi:hypothetical protein